MSLLSWPVRLVGFLAWYAGELIRTNTIAAAVMTGVRQLPRPVVLRHPCRSAGPVEVTLLSILVSLTPGTLVLATRQGRDGWELFVHEMYTGDIERAKASIVDLENRMLTGVRPRPDAARPASEAGVAARRVQPPRAVDRRGDV